MSVKIIFGLLALVISTITGIKLSEKFKLRKEYYKTLSEFNSVMKEEVYFAKNTLPTIINKIKYKNDLIDFLKQYILSLESKISLDLKKFWYLTDEERNNLFFYVETLSKTDSINLKQYLTNLENKINNKLNIAEIEEKKYRSLYMKLGFLTGLLVLVLII